MKKITLLTFLLLASFGFAQNLLRDGDFENIDPMAGGQAAGQVAIVTGIAPSTTIWHSSQTAGANNVRPYIISNVANARAGLLYVNLPDGFQIVRQSFTAVPGTEYTLTFYSFFNNGAGSATPIINGLDGTFLSVRTDDGAGSGNGTVLVPAVALYINPLLTTNTYRKYTVNFTAPSANLILLFQKQTRAGAINNAQRLDDLSIVPATFIWTGAASSDWTNTGNWSAGNVPTASSSVTIQSGGSSPVINSNVTIESLKINSGATLTVNPAFNLTIEGGGAITNFGTLNIESGANLLQNNMYPNTGTGVTNVKRNSNALFREDYTIWSSPTTLLTQFLKTFSPATLNTRFYNYNQATNLYNVVAAPTTQQFVVGTGYLIRMPDTDALPGYDAGTAALTFPGVFAGNANSGPITKAMTYAGATFGYNMVGNPYPSTIDAQAFITANTANIESTLYFWRKKNGALGTAYATYNAVGPVATGSGLTGTGSEAPNGTIQVGQGFFVKAKSASNLIFTNAMRLGTVSTQFFKTKQVTKDRVWVNLTNTAGVFSQALVGYLADATQGVDNYDAKYINDSPIALTSNINDEEYTIQGRPAFDASDVVALNFKTDVKGDYTIALDHFDGVFATGQAVYLVDSKTGVETDLKAGGYNFTVDAAGVDNARFTLKYQKTLKVDAPAFNDSSVSVYKNNGSLYVNSGSAAINTIEVYDVQGRLLASQKNVKATTATISNVRAINQVLIVKIVGENNSVVNKKVMN